MKLTIDKSKDTITFSKGKGSLTLLLNGTAKKPKEKAQTTLKDWLKKH